jgi:putative ABC transport system permease protein
VKFVHIMTRSLRLIWRFRLRSTLMLLSAVLGVSGVIASVNYASGGRQKVLNQIRRMGTNVLSVQPQQSRSVGGRARTGAIVTTLVEQDYAALRRDVAVIRRSSGIANGGFLIKAGDLSKNNCAIVGAEPDYIRIKNWPVMQGDFFDTGELRRSARVAVLGHTVAQELFGDEPPIGQRLFINRVPFEIIGVMTERGQGLDVTNEDNQVYIPLSTAMHRLMNVDYYSGLLLEVDRWEDMDGAAQSVTGMLRLRHHASAKLPEDFRIQNQKELIDTQLAAAEKLGFFVRWIGMSGLLVSGLGILAISWIAIKERTVEIGTRRALGATASDVFFQMLFEAAVVSSIGCGLGLAAGWKATQIIAGRVDQPFVFEWANARFALTCAILLNLLFALIPSRKAARLDPIQALKYE